MIQMPKNWARVNVRRFHSKSAAYAGGFTAGWEAALRAVQVEHTAMIPARILGYPNRTEGSSELPVIENACGYCGWEHPPRDHSKDTNRTIRHEEEQSNG